MLDKEKYKSDLRSLLRKLYGLADSVSFTGGDDEIAGEITKIGYDIDALFIKLLDEMEAE